MTPLRLVVAPEAVREAEAARRWLESLSPSSEKRFSARLEAVLLHLCDTLPNRIASGRPPQIDLDASEGLLRPVFQERFHTSAKKPPRRSNQSVWRIFYSLRDENGDGIPEILEFRHVIHAAAQLPWHRFEVEEDDE